MNGMNNPLTLSLSKGVWGVMPQPSGCGRGGP